MRRHGFELAGGHAALDFLDTIHDWNAAAPRDHLAAPRDAVRFGAAVGLLTAGEARQLAGAVDEAELAALRTLRAVLERIFRALVGGRAPRRADLAWLDDARAALAGAIRLRPAGDRLRDQLRFGDAGAALLRLRLTQAALSLLTVTGLDRVKDCPSCGWFFIDASKNRSRRWCNMATCGASAKARRYYRRSRAARVSPSHRARSPRA